MSQLELWTEQDEVALQYNEQVIQDGLETYMKVGYALMEIRDNRLYRKEFKTFEEYCHKKWDKTSRWAQRMMKASEVVGVLEDATNWSQIPETIETIPCPWEGEPLETTAIAVECEPVKPVLLLPPAKKEPVKKSPKPTKKTPKNTDNNLQSLSIRALKKMASERKIPRYSSLTKSQLIEAIAA